MLVVKLDEEFTHARKMLQKGKYSQMYSEKQLNNIKKAGYLNRNFHEVVTKSKARKEFLEEQLNCRIPDDTELDEYFHPERNIYDYKSKPKQAIAAVEL